VISSGVLLTGYRAVGRESADDLNMTNMFVVKRNDI
jgi:hypothetical protein